MSKKVYRLISWGGLGDLALSTPLFRELKRRDKDCRVIVFCGGASFRRDIFLHNPHIDVLKSFSFFSDPWSGILFRMRQEKFTHLNYGKWYPSIFGDKGAACLVAEILGMQLEDPRIQIFLTPGEDRAGEVFVRQFENPIALHITSRGINKYWDRQDWEAVVRSMPGYSFLQLGGLEEEKVEGAVDLRGKTTLREAMSIIRHCVSFAGVDSVFSHVTNAFDVPGVVLFGPTSPEIWGHSNNINLRAATRCAPCIDLLANSPCPYDRACMRNIDPHMVRDALLRQVDVGIMRSSTIMVS